MAKNPEEVLETLEAKNYRAPGARQNDSMLNLVQQLVDKKDTPQEIRNAGILFLREANKLKVAVSLKDEPGMGGLAHAAAQGVNERFDEFRKLATGAHAAAMGQYARAIDYKGRYTQPEGESQEKYGFNADSYSKYLALTRTFKAAGGKEIRFLDQIKSVADTKTKPRDDVEKGNREAATRFMELHDVMSHMLDHSEETWSGAAADSVMNEMHAQLGHLNRLSKQPRFKAALQKLLAEEPFIKKQPDENDQSMLNNPSVMNEAIAASRRGAAVMTGTRDSEGGSEEELPNQPYISGGNGERQV